MTTQVTPEMLAAAKEVITGPALPIDELLTGIYSAMEATKPNPHAAEIDLANAILADLIHNTPDDLDMEVVAYVLYTSLALFLDEAGWEIAEDFDEVLRPFLEGDA